MSMRRSCLSISGGTARILLFAGGVWEEMTAGSFWRDDPLFPQPGEEVEE
jgi:hypothetical protein